MKKILIAALVAIFILSSCSKKEETKKEETKKEETKKEETKKDFAYFKSEAKKIVPDFSETVMAGEMIGAKTGHKFKKDELTLEIYEFDKNSEEYKKAEKDQKICLSESMCFETIVKNGYALSISENFPQKDKIISIFNELK